MKVKYDVRISYPVKNVAKQQKKENARANGGKIIALLHAVSVVEISSATKRATGLKADARKILK